MQPEWLAPDVVDLAAVRRWGETAGLEGPITDVGRIGGGTQNVVLRLRWDGRDLVLRRPPEHPRESSNNALRREMQVLSALAGTDVPHPGYVAGCTDESVLGGVVFYLMDAVDGDNPGERVGEPYRSDPAARHAAGLDTAAALARLASVDHEAVGLGGVGRPEGFLARQVPRWLKHLASYDDLPGYPGSTLPHVEPLARWLDAHRPPDGRPGIVHGDYHLNNVLLASDAPRVAAVVDWEMCTIGDPLLDLGGCWSPGRNRARRPRPAWRWPSSATSRTATSSSRTTRRAATATCPQSTGTRCSPGLKFAIVIEGTHARAMAGQADPDVGLRLHRSAVASLERVAAVAGV